MFAGEKINFTEGRPVFVALYQVYHNGNTYRDNVAPFLFLRCNSYKFTFSIPTPASPILVILK